MHIITKKRLKNFWQQQPDAESPLRIWSKIAEKASWQNLTEVRAILPTADPYCECTIFNIGGNKYRLIAHINYRRRKLYVLHVLTHKEYDKEKWKDDCNC
ncbi:MAG: type II toxin-antitoxin system HigB family toxin [Acidobacteriota bacterium]|nr:type II toxin-antitoxin system HigB family toxin [Acidobacteriota bacterium]